MQNLLTGEAGIAAMPRGPAHDHGDDWLGMEEGWLEALHEEAFALLGDGCADEAETARHVALVALVQQLVMARALVRHGRLAASAARAALRSDHARGYILGLAAHGGDPVAGPPGERQTARALLALHETVFGTEEARRLERARTFGAFDVVGEAFGRGLLAAEEDLAGFRLLLFGLGGALPQRLLAGLPCATLARGGGAH